MNNKKEQAKEYLLQIPLWTKKKNTLEQVRDFLRELGDPESGLNVIHVAGTNGKGSVCANLTAILNQAGYRTGTFISPHLVDIRERFLLNGDMVTEEQFQAIFSQVLSVVKKMTGNGYCHPTFFEFCFLMAMVLFAKEKVDYCILETGLGGRLDTTNVIRRPLICVITSVSLEHTMYLGSTIEEIAAEKAGIIKPGIPVVYDDNQPEASAVIRKKAMEQNAPSYSVSVADCESEVHLRHLLFDAPYQVMNAGLALKALKVLHIPGVDYKVCRAGLKSVHWPGRMEEVRPGIWLDGAHNPGGIWAFVQAVNTAVKKEPIQLLFAAVSDKDFREMICMLCDGLPIERVTVAHLDSERSADEVVLAEQFAAAGCPCVEQYPTVEEALTAALAHKRPDGRLYVVGSLYLIGEIRECLRKKQEVRECLILKKS